MTTELVPRWDVKGSVIIIKNPMNTALLTTTELDRFLCGLSEEGLNLFFQKIPNTSSYQLRGNRCPVYPVYFYHNVGLRSNLINLL